MLKSSNYNFFYPNGEDIIAYNSFRNSLAILTSQDYKEYQNAINNEYEDKKTQTLDELIRCGFLIEDSYDELGIIKHRMNRSRYFTGVLGLTIAPTTCCNLRCIYCYEEKIHRDIVMDECTQQAIIDYVRKCSEKIDHLHISWYGGEPLLALNIIENLSDAFMQICEDKSIQYSASIVTNGYLLDKSTAQKLVDKKIFDCQITIDGDQESHNTRRPHCSGKGTYETIITNLINIDGIIPNISIRVNTDKNNMHGLSKICDIIKDNNLHNISPYASPIQDYSGNYCVGECFTQKAFLEYEYENLLQIGNQEMIMRKYPHIRSNACCADSMCAFVINADGKLYKCWSDIGSEELSLGNIQDGVINEMNAIRYLLDDPTNDSKCRECKLLPICMGGCPRKRKAGDADKCIYYEELNELYLKKYIQITENKQST